MRLTRRKRAGIITAGAEAAAWFTRAVGKPCLLGRKSATAVRVLRAKNEDAALSGTIGLANEAQFLLVSLASVRALREAQPDLLPGCAGVEKEDDDAHLGALVERFRPNIVVAGCAAFEEERWSSLRLGPVALQAIGPCVRCPVVNIDQRNGSTDVNVLRAVSALRTAQGRSTVTFGMLFQQMADSISSDGDAWVRAGDRIDLSAS